MTILIMPFHLNSPSAIRCTLDTLRSRKFEGIDEALCREADVQALNYAEQDFTVGLAAVKAKNPRPDFKGW